MNSSEIQEKLFSLQDKQYQSFQSKLVPTIPSERIIGVRIPVMRELAKELSKSEKISDFLSDLPHTYLEENTLHGLIISTEKNYEKAIAETKKFLPYVDNWATCDIMSPKIFKKHLPELIKEIEVWIHSDLEYTVRFGIGMLMQFYLDKNFDEKYIKMVSDIKSDALYVNLMIAWYFATALAKQYNASVTYIENRCLESWTHNKTIQKAIESNRITIEHKEYLKTLKISRN